MLSGKELIQGILDGAKRKEMNISKLLEYADICGVKKKMEPMIKAILS